jgi:hypothetical protein
MVFTMQGSDFEFQTIIARSAAKPPRVNPLIEASEFPQANVATAPAAFVMPAARPTMSNNPANRPEYRFHPLPFQTHDDESDFILLATAATIVLARLCVTSAIRAGAQERRATAPVRVS